MGDAAGGDDGLLAATSAQVTGDLAEPVAHAAGRIVALVPTAPAVTLGWLGDSPDPLPDEPAWRRLLFSPTHRDAPQVMLSTDRVGSVSTAVAHRLLGALEAVVRDLAVPVPEPVTRLLGRTAVAVPDEAGERVSLTDVPDRFNAFAVPTQLAGLRAPAAEPLVTALVHALAGTVPVAAFLEVGAGSIPGMAAEHGRRHLAVAVAVSTVVLRAAARAGEPACPDGAETIVGVALEAVSRVLGERPMPPAWAAARREWHRREYVLPRWSAVRLRARGGRFAFIEGDELPDAGPGRVTVVPGGIVVRTRRPDAAVTLDVEVVAGPPGDPGDGVTDWDEVVETSYTAGEGGAAAVGGPGSVWPEREFGLAFPWPGGVRIRVHARDRDDDEHYRLLMWEAGTAPDVVHLAADPARLALLWLRADVPAILRTDFDHDGDWQVVRDALVTLDPDDPARLDVVDDERFAGVTPDRVLELAGPDWSARYGEIYLVDRTTLTEPERPVLVIGLLDDDRGRSFRAAARSVAMIEANLQIANLSFDDYARWAGDGVLDVTGSL